MPATLELSRWLDSLWIPVAIIASLLVLLVLWEVALLLGVHVALTRKEHAGDD